ncbi:MAG TPA: tetratricopeptide repeat protein [bacterium]|jgi:TPR repeat protein|nr:tetratricopeptide repeat protein [bacterium]
MRCVFAAFAMFGSLALLQPAVGLAAAPLNLDEVMPEEPPEQACDRLAANPFMGFGPDEWGKPFQSIDPYRAIPACSEAMKLHPDERRYMLQLALADIAGDKKEQAKPLLDELIAQGNTSAMLALAFISPEVEAAELMLKAANAGDPNAMMLFAMAQLTGKGVAKNEIDGIRMLRRAAESGSTRAMLILGHFYKDGSYGIGFNQEEAIRLIAQAAKRGDPAAANILLSMEEESANKTAEPR